MFASDNAAPAHPVIMDAIARANVDVAPSYGADRWTLAAEAALREIFETDCTVLLTVSGTAANALALAALCPPWGAVICHKDAHIACDEAGAPEFFTGGAKLILLDGAHAKLTPDQVEAEARRHPRHWVHGAQPFVVSITQATESGASYSAAEMAALGETCRANGLKLHVDGARFANAVAFTGASPAELTWRAGVDALSFGATKNGALAAEALIFFGDGAATAAPHLRKRAGHLLSKHRFLGAQMEAYLKEGLWLELARHANAMASDLAAHLTKAGADLAHPLEANEVFVRMRPELVRRLEAAGVSFYPWEADGAGVYRFVTSWATQADNLATVARALKS